MKKALMLLVLCALLLFPISPLFAEFELQEDDVVVGGSFATRVSYEGSIDASGAFGDKTVRTPPLPEASTTDDTLTATETGKTFVYNGTTTNLVLNLPTAAAGLEYTFIDGVGSATGTFGINPADGDTIQYSETPFDAGDKLVSPGNTGDSVTLIAVGTLNWHVQSMTGTWTDGGA